MFIKIIKLYVRKLTCVFKLVELKYTHLLYSYYLLIICCIHVECNFIIGNNNDMDDDVQMISFKILSDLSEDRYNDDSSDSLFQAPTIEDSYFIHEYIFYP